MINTFSIIVNDKVVYVSRVDEEPRFEVVIFANSLSRKLSEYKWKIHKLILSPLTGTENEQILIRQIYYPEFDLDVLYCVNGDFQEGSKVGYEMLESFQERVEKVYKPEIFNEMVSNKRIIFQQICEEIAYYLEQSYLDRINSEENLHETFEGEPLLVYSGISCQGLPIVSKMHNPSTLIYDELNEDEKKAKVEFLESTISGQLATISINSFIRAKSYVSSIQFLINEEKRIFGFIKFAQVGINKLYTLEIFTLGTQIVSNEFFRRIKNSAKNFECLQNPFCGELKPYTDLKDFLSKLELK